VTFQGSTQFHLGAKALSEGYRLVYFDAVGSTNSEALAAARIGEADRTWFATSRQTAGRGRRGRPWHSPQGNLAASLLIEIDSASPNIAGLGFVAGVALGRTLNRLLPDAGLQVALDGADGKTETGARARVALKWPNDVLADGAKLAGILLESERLPNGAQAIAVGLGINVVAAPADVPYPATSMNAFGTGTEAAEVFAALSDAWCEAFDIWDFGSGLSGVLDEWRKMAGGLGETISVATSGGVERGIFETIDETGRLCLRRPNGELITISAGDVHFGAMAMVREGIQ